MQCNHEQADTRALVHLLHALQTSTLGMIHTGDTKNCKALALIHAFTGSDSTSLIKFKGNRYCCNVIHKVPSLIEEFANVVDTPFQTSPRMEGVVTSSVCRLCFNDSDYGNDIDLVRPKVMDNSAYVHDASRQPYDHGWKKKDKLLLIWTSLPLARDVFHLEVKCSCKGTCFMCKCTSAKLKCTRLCKCT